MVGVCQDLVTSILLVRIHMRDVQGWLATCGFLVAIESYNWTLSALRRKNTERAPSNMLGNRECHMEGTLGELLQVQIRGRR